ncbi:MAG: hypothetical protein JWQ98_2761 [Chlorobi bacterium]|nr:hypothetical protein [Chlorobiota bacterium]
MLTRSFPRIPGFSRIIVAILYLILGITAGFFPLVNDLHYEFSALAALVASLLAGLSILLRRRAHTLASDDGDTMSATGADAASGRRIWRNIVVSVVLALIPLAVALVRSLFMESCGLWEGISWYLLLVPASAAISVVLAAVAGRITGRRWLACLIFLLLWSGSLFRGAYEALTGPHIFMYAWQIGFFPGGSWDAELPITTTLIIYRAAHLLIAAVLAALVAGFPRTRARVADAAEPNVGRHFLPGPVPVIATLLALAVIPLLLHRSDLGLTRTDRWLRAELGDSLTTRFATIYYHAPSADSVDLWRAANLTDFYIAEHALALGIARKDIEPVTLYLYSSSGEEKRLVGTASASFTKPWARKLSMPFGGVGSTLRHELAHVMIAPFGNILGISSSQGLIEGSAMAMENNRGWRTLHEHARYLFQFTMAPPAEGIISTSGFSSHGSSVAYVEAGSFCKWLIDSYGMPKFLKAFPSSDFDNAYGRSLHQLSGEYRRFIDSIPPADSIAYGPAMRYLFGGGSFFLQKCLRRMGTLNSRGYAALAEGRYDDALQRFRESLDEGTNYSARAGILRTLSGRGDFRSLLDSGRVYDRDTASYPLLPFLIDRGDAWWALGDTARARRLYDSVLAMNIGDDIATRAALRIFFMVAPDTLGAVMREYFTQPLPAIQRIRVLDHALEVAPEWHLRRILTLMRASLSVNQYPRTVLGEHPPEVVALPSRSSNQLDQAGLFGFLEQSIALGMRDAGTYVLLLRNGGHRDDLADYVAMMGNQDDRFLRSHSQAGILASAAYINERRTEAGRFLEFLRGHTILPSSH